MSTSLKLSNPNNTKFPPFSLTFGSLAFPPSHLRLPFRRRYTPFSLQSHFDPSSPSPSHPSISSDYIASVGSSPTLHLPLTQRHLLFLNFIACAAAISATWLFFSAIPTLLAFKRAAESLEKLMDATREELPDTMAAIRLSGMEISDLTMELSDIGQEITQGVRTSTKAVRVAEQRLRQFKDMAMRPASLQMVASQNNKTGGPVVARNARAIKEGIVKGRGVVQLFLTFTRFSMLALNYFKRRAKK